MNTHANILKLNLIRTLSPILLKDKPQYYISNTGSILLLQIQNKNYNFQAQPIERPNDRLMIIELFHLINIYVKLKHIQIYFMPSNVKTHRRNKAAEHSEDYYRFSIPTNATSIPRHSFQSNSQAPLMFRQSDMPNINIQIHTPKKQTVTKQAFSNKSIITKTPSTLLSTLKSLQEKLSQAKKQLIFKDKTLVNESNFQLNSFKQSSSNGGQWIEDSLLQKLQQSTINLESQKKLFNSIKSKERILWANKIKTYYLSQAIKGIIGINERALQHLTISLQILKSCHTLSFPREKACLKEDIVLPISAANKDKKVLVIDLDQTLFHCSQERNSPEDIEINLEFDDIHEKAYFSIRPFAISFLKRVKKHFEIIAFTASQRSYADAILNEIDPDRQLIQHRLYREHCIKLNNKIYAKDLRIIGRDLRKVVLVDNSPFSYLYQLENAIPILPYYSGQDTELLSLQRYLDNIRKQSDVRRMNRQTFQLNRYNEFSECQQLVQQLYCNYSYN